MKTLRNFIFYLIIIALMTWIYYYYMRDIEERLAPCLIFSISFGFFSVVGYLAIKSAFNLHTDRRNIEFAQQGALPKHGRRSAILGSIEPLGEPLISPFSRQPCIGYEYKVYHMGKITSGTQGTSGVSEIYDFEGWAVTPSAIKSDFGKVNIIGFFDFMDFPFNKGHNYENANGFIETTAFTRSSILNIFSPKKLLGIKDSATGVKRDDLRHTDAKSADDLTLEERVVPVGAKVCAIGKYSSKNNGVMKTPRIIKGDVQKVSSRLKGDFRGRLIVGSLMIGISGLMVFFLNPRMVEFPRQIIRLITG